MIRSVGAHRLIGGAIAALVVCFIAVMDAQAEKTTWDGVYTEEQATRGRQIYTAQCGQCHGDALGGVEAAPALTGTAFYANWEGETLNALFERMRTSMPQNAPGSLSRLQNAELLAYILQTGGYPGGSTTLEGQAATLLRITIRTHKPQGGA